MVFSRSASVEPQRNDDSHDGDQDHEDNKQNGRDGPLGLLFGRYGFGFGDVDVSGHCEYGSIVLHGKEESGHGHGCAIEGDLHVVACVTCVDLCRYGVGSDFEHVGVADHLHAIDVQAESGGPRSLEHEGLDD